MLKSSAAIYSISDGDLRVPTLFLYLPIDSPTYCSHPPLPNPTAYLSTLLFFLTHRTDCSAVYFPYPAAYKLFS